MTRQRGEWQRDMSLVAYRIMKSSSAQHPNRPLGPKSSLPKSTRVPSPHGKVAGTWSRPFIFTQSQGWNFVKQGTRPEISLGEGTDTGAMYNLIDFKIYVAKPCLKRNSNISVHANALYAHKYNYVFHDALTQFNSEELIFLFLLFPAKIS
jgi:hypothetical protein